MPYVGPSSYPYGSPSGRRHTYNNPQCACMALMPMLFTHPTSLSDMGSYLFSPLAIHRNSCTSFNHTHQSYNPLSYQTAATSTLNRPNHSRSPSLSKCPVSLPSKKHPDTTSNKHTCSFCADAQQPSQSTAHQPRKTYPQSPTVLPVCAVCLRRHKHSMPVIFCAAKRTWDDQFETFVERFNKALRVRETGATLCSPWQHDNGCSKKHNNMHLCSGCGALTHGTNKCPCTQRVMAQNSL